MEPLDRKYFYFLGIGGIGMSALARYFKHLGREVWGYDRTRTELTIQLEQEGMVIHYEDSVSLIPGNVLSHPEESLIVYTPAIPRDHNEYNYLREKESYILKRSQLLGMIVNSSEGVAVAGTHGKTTVSTMISHLLVQADLPAMAFVGGISKNYHSNLILGKGNRYIVAEADEFDRSFLQLTPHLAVITSADADHLDIYGSHEEVLRSFGLFAKQVKDNGILILKKGLPFTPAAGRNIRVFTYSAREEADFYAMDHHYIEGRSRFTLVTPSGQEGKIEIGLPGKANVENAVAALAAGISLGVPVDRLRQALAGFAGVVRRFDIQVHGEKYVYIDDYAHHPEELKAIINAAREMFPGRKLTGIFQPHLYTRTRDFADGFAESLSLLDELILLEIYPARELPIEGVNSRMILDRVNLPAKRICQKDELMNILKESDIEVLLTLGAGDIDNFVKPIGALVSEMEEGVEG